MKFHMTPYPTARSHNPINFDRSLNVNKCYNAKYFVRRGRGESCVYTMFHFYIFILIQYSNIQCFYYLFTNTNTNKRFQGVYSFISVLRPFYYPVNDIRNINFITYIETESR